MCITLTLTGLTFFMDLPGVYVVAATLGCHFAYQTTIAPLAWLIISEIFPTRVRAKGMGIAAVVLWISSYTSVQMFPTVAAYCEETFGSVAGVFWLFAIVCVAAFVFCWRMVPETKDKTLEQIGEMWIREGSARR